MHNVPTTMLMTIFIAMRHEERIFSMIAMMMIEMDKMTMMMFCMSIMSNKVFRNLTMLNIITFFVNSMHGDSLYDITFEVD